MQLTRSATVYLLVLVVFVVPGLVFAAGEFEEVGGFMDGVSKFISAKLIPFVFTLALLVFIYGIFQYFILGGADEDSRDKGKKLMLWAIIGFVVMVSVWGIVALVAGGLGLNNDTIDTPSGPAIRGPDDWRPPPIRPGGGPS